ncbi:MAG: MBL fold metallo-hydrolase [Candidatus Bathyarchaeota archaeon]|jgi:glyoxylase-like metal-dependent hydrolase (beta-lactamase superfamily II)|nr:MBL fold metallo-hydrolase [Candidatus Bathyarchaeota archaeon A05DMB-5]MDH7557819.1 MBL fold metallo-hydrolase [Candidatus Bathyarchaeota archaeon]
MKQRILPWFKVEPLTDNVFLIAEPGHIEEVNSYLVIGKQKAILIDSGMGIGNIKTVVKNLTNLPITVINTHSHYDHVGDNYRFANVLVHEMELANVHSGIPKEQISYVVDDQNFFTLAPHTRSSRFTRGEVRPIPSEFDRTQFQIHPCPWASSVKKRQILDLGSTKLEVLHTPGHSSGSICLFDRDNKYLFAGDTVYQGPIYFYLPDFPKSVQFLATYESQVKYVFPGHNKWTPLNSGILKELAQATRSILAGNLEFKHRNGFRVFDKFKRFEILVKEDLFLFTPMSRTTN